MGAYDGKVAFITGGARGQGRSHAVNLARGGADVLLLDICRPLPFVEYPMPTADDLAETAELVHREGGRAVAVEGDVREYADVQTAVSRGLDELGRIDFVVANAGILPTTGEPAQEVSAWHAAIDTLLTGVYFTLRAASEPMIAAGRGGSIVITSSTAGLRASSFKVSMLNPGQVGYNAAKHGVLGIMRDFAVALGPYGIRVNTVHPMGVRTPMVVNEALPALIRDAPPGWMGNVMGLDLLEPQDVTDTVLWLLSDAARYITGTSIPIDAGTVLI